ALAGLINAVPVNNLGDSSNYVIAPQSPGHSVLLTRASTRGTAIQMPPLDSNLVDIEATNLLTQWILSMTNMFWVGVTPDSQSVGIGGAVNYTVAYIATTDFVDTVTFSVDGLPAGANAAFNPPTANSTTNSTLTITTSGATPNGTYPLTLN